MAPNFSSHSSPENIRPEIEVIISQATDLCALEQIAALNTSHISDDSSLPTHLESRFRKLKSLPVANPQPRTTPHCTSPAEEEEEEENIIPKSLNQSQSLPTPSFVDLNEDQITGPVKQEEKAAVEDPKLRKSEFNISRGSPSPPRQTCCFWCYSKKDMKKKAKGIEDWWENDEILSSLKEQQRKLKKALKEQEQVSQEAEKMVKWIKQASAKMNARAIDELLSDDEEFK